MSRIAARFAALRAEGRGALIPFLEAWDPDPATSMDILRGMPAAGADLIEIGCPFTDPMADGPTIQRSSERAIARGAGLSWVLEAVREFRQRDAVTPVVLMGYLNPIEIRGSTRFANDAVAAGVDGVLLVDLPPEEAAELRAAFAVAGLALILLASPTTTDERIALLCDDAQGYLYYVSFAGVTGADRLDAGAANDRLRGIRQRSKVPVVAGFGIKDADSAAAMAREAEGVVVGSALVAVLAQAGSADAAAQAARDFLAPLRAALDQV